MLHHRSRSWKFKAKAQNVLIPELARSIQQSHFPSNLINQNLHYPAFLNWLRIWCRNLWNFCQNPFFSHCNAWRSWKLISLFVQWTSSSFQRCQAKIKLWVYSEIPILHSMHCLLKLPSSVKTPFSYRRSNIKRWTFQIEVIQKNYCLKNPLDLCQSWGVSTRSVWNCRLQSRSLCSSSLNTMLNDHSFNLPINSKNESHSRKICQNHWHHFSKS